MSAEGGQFTSPISSPTFVLPVCTVCDCVVISLRFLVHRYSVLQQHAEANGIEGVDELDTHTTEMGKTHYHEDSDEVHTLLAYTYTHSFCVTQQFCVQYITSTFLLLSCIMLLVFFLTIFSLSLCVCLWAYICVRVDFPAQDLLEWEASCERLNPPTWQPTQDYSLSPLPPPAATNTAAALRLHSYSMTANSSYIPLPFPRTLALKGYIMSCRGLESSGTGAVGLGPVEGSAEESFCVPKELLLCLQPSFLHNAFWCRFTDQALYCCGAESQGATAVALGMVCLDQNEFLWYSTWYGTPLRKRRYTKWDVESFQLKWYIVIHLVMSEIIFYQVQKIIIFINNMCEVKTYTKCVIVFRLIPALVWPH